MVIVMNSTSPASATWHNSFIPVIPSATGLHSGRIRESACDLEAQANHVFGGLQNLSEGGRALVLRRVIALHNQQASMAKNKIETPAAQVDFKVQYPVLNGTIKKMATILTVTEIQEFEIIVLGSKSSRMSEAYWEFSSVLRAKEAFFRQYFLHFGIALGINLLLNIGIGFYPKHQERIFSLLRAMYPEYVEVQQ